MTNEEKDRIVERYKAKYGDVKRFHEIVLSYFRNTTEIASSIHTIKYRLKDPDHLREKLDRKFTDREDVNVDNMFSKITDLAGVRILHLYPIQFDTIHRCIMKYIDEGDWRLDEEPIAYTWDPDAEKHYKELGVKTELRETYYTSIHYVVRPNNNVADAPRCEIQVRTLFEEIWGEIDHSINYPHPTNNLACREQLRVLAKLVSTGTRLADAIHRCYNALE